MLPAYLALLDRYWQAIHAAAWADAVHALMAEADRLWPKLRPAERERVDERQ